MAVLKINYEGEDYLLDLDDMELSQARAMERFGVPNLKALEEGMIEGNIDALTVAYWLMLTQNGEPGVRLERVKLEKPMKFCKAVLVAMMVALKEAEAAMEEDPKEEDGQPPQDSASTLRV